MLGVIDNKKRLIWTVLLGSIFTLLFFQLPNLLRYVPSRYVARLPEPMQVLGERGDGVPILPPVLAPLDAVAVLAELTSPTPTTVAAVVSAPPTPTLVPVEGKRSSELVVTSTNVLPTAVPPTITPQPIPSAVRLEGFQHIFQTWNNCGPATTAMALSYFGSTLNQADTAAALKPNPEDRNVSPYQITRYVNEQTPFAALDRTNGRLETIKELVASGFPVVIELGIEPPGEYRWLGWYGHYLLVVAYDDALEQLWVYDSWFGTSETPMENTDKNGRVLTYADADYQWRQFNRNYITFYPPERQAEVTIIIGEDMDDGTMWQKSLTRAQTELNLDLDDPFLWFNLGTIYNQFGEYERAVTAFDQARSIGLPWRMLWYQFGPYEAYYQVGRIEDVLLLAEVTLKDRPYFEESYYYQGLAQEALGDVDAARASFQKAAAFNPRFQPAVDALIQLND